MEDILRSTTLALIPCLTASRVAVGQWMGRHTGCYAQTVTASPVAAHPNRPTAANPADITQYGVLELEYGWDHFWPESGIHQTSVGGLLKFALLCDVELRWDTTSFLSQTDSIGTHRGVGDNWLGPQIRFYRQTTRVDRLNKTTRGFVSSLGALTYTITPRLVIDGGFELGLTSGGPHRHVFFGATYSIANLYRAWRRRRSSGPSTLRPKSQITEPAD